MRHKGQQGAACLDGQDHLRAEAGLVVERGGQRRGADPLKPLSGLGTERYVENSSLRTLARHRLAVIGWIAVVRLRRQAIGSQRCRDARCEGLFELPA